LARLGPAAPHRANRSPILEIDPGVRISPIRGWFVHQMPKFGKFSVEYSSYDESSAQQIAVMQIARDDDHLGWNSSPKPQPLKVLDGG